jgi:hypothetical protein
MLVRAHIQVQHVVEAHGVELRYWECVHAFTSGILQLLERLPPASLRQSPCLGCRVLASLVSNQILDLSDTNNQIVTCLLSDMLLLFLL